MGESSANVEDDEQTRLIAAGKIEIGVLPLDANRSKSMLCEDDCATTVKEKEEALGFDERRSTHDGVCCGAPRLDKLPAMPEQRRRRLRGMERRRPSVPVDRASMVAVLPMTTTR